MEYNMENQTLGNRNRSVKLVRPLNYIYELQSLVRCVSIYVLVSDSHLGAVR